MHSRPIFRRRPRYTYAESDGGGHTGGGSLRFVLIAAAAILVLAIVSTSIYLKGDYDGDQFVTFQKSESGEVTAISSNMARINELSSKILDKVVGSTQDNTITIEIPSGNLTGASLLMGRGPRIPVRIVVLSSSRVEFSNGIVTAGINQTKHQISLRVTVDMEILVPWGTENTQVSTDVLIADTVIVGKVPDTYLNMQQNER